jgi:hypothetical protein
MQKYRFLSIAQFARFTAVRYDHAAEKLRELENRRVVGYFGYTSIPGQGRTPKIYFLTRRGYDWLISESDGTVDEIGPFRDVHREFTWTPQMYHRLRLLDCFIALEIAVKERAHLTLTRTFLEYRCIKGTQVRETTRYVAAPEIAANRIVPDGVFVLENREKDRRGLFFVEMDMGTERITAPQSQDPRATIQPFAQRGTVVKDHADPVRLGSGAKEGILLPGTVSAPATQARTKEGDLRRRRVHAHRDLPYVARWHRLQRPRRRPLPPLTGGPRATSRQANRKARLHLHDRSRTASRGSFYLDQVSTAAVQNTGKSSGKASSGLRHGERPMSSLSTTGRLGLMLFLSESEAADGHARIDHKQVPEEIPGGIGAVPRGRRA